MMKRLYLDNCSIQRPLDDERFPRIRLEAEAVSVLLSLCQATEEFPARVLLVVSDISFVENDKNPNTTRKSFGAGVLAQAAECIELTDVVTERANVLIGYGITPFDAFHLACAEAGNVDYFCTCDDKLIKKARKYSTIAIHTPISCCEELL